jgi:hypothetical protein
VPGPFSRRTHACQEPSYQGASTGRRCTDAASRGTSSSWTHRPRASSRPGRSGAGRSPGGPPRGTGWRPGGSARARAAPSSPAPRSAPGSAASRPAVTAPARSAARRRGGRPVCRTRRCSGGAPPTPGWRARHGSARPAPAAAPTGRSPRERQQPGRGGSLPIGTGQREHRPGPSATFTAWTTRSVAATRVLPSGVKRTALTLLVPSTGPRQTTSLVVLERRNTWSRSAIASSALSGLNGTARTPPSDETVRATLPGSAIGHRYPPEPHRWSRR